MKTKLVVTVSRDESVGRLSGEIQAREMKGKKRQACQRRAILCVQGFKRGSVNYAKQAKVIKHCIWRVSVHVLLTLVCVTV